MDDLQILVKAVVDANSETALNSQLSSLVKSVAASHEIKLKVVLDDSSIKTAQSQLQAITKQASSASAGGKKGSTTALKVFDPAQLEADGQRYFLSVQDIVARAQAEFSKLGKVDITNVFKDAKGNIQSFSANVTKADGVVERFNFNLAKIQQGSKALKGFVQSNSVLSDKNAGTNLEQTLNYLNRVDNKIADITSKTLTNSSKPLLGDMEQYNQYQTKLQEVQARIQEIKSLTTTLSAEHKRKIDSMVADLQRYAKELQTSAYAATDLKANTFSNQKAELQATLETNIKKWQNSGLFGGDFKASVEEAKAALDSALNPQDLDNYRHRLTLLQQQFKQMKLDSGQANSVLDTERLNTNIQSAQLRIQNLKQTYSSFLSDPTLVSKWQQLFDSSQMITSNKELTNLNAKIRLFEQELIQAGKHSHSLWSELSNNVQKMASWMVLGGVIAGIMRGVTGLYDAVLELDSAMVELRKVTDETDATYDKFLSIAADKAVEIGTSYSDFVNSAADFARLGYDINDATNLAEVANIYSVVGDEIKDINTATSSIISTMKAFGIEASDAMIIVDKFNEVGNNFAISSGGIGDAMQRSAASLAAANNTIDESIALIVAANNVIQDPDVVGTMWKTVSMRIRGAKTELEEAGLETEFMAESTAKLRDEIKGLTNVKGLGGFDIMKDDKTFKSTYDIILGISKVWKDMSDIDQAALLELLAGKRQGNALAAALTNMDDAVKVLRTSVDAEGSALAEHEKWMDSIQAKQQQFEAQYQAFANAFVNSELIKGVYDTGTGMLGWLTKLVETLGALPTLFAAITPFFNKMQLFKTDTSKNWLGTGTGFSFAWNANKIDIDGDIKLLEDYNAKIQGLGTSVNDLNQRQIIWNDTIGRGSNSLKTAVHVTDSATISSDAYRTATQSASTSTVALGVASKAAAIGVNVLKTALNMLISFGIGLAISALVSAISGLINKAKEAREASIEAGRAAVESNANLLELASSYITLSNAVEAGTGSQEELASIQDELIQYLKTQGIAVQDLAGDYDDLRGSIIAAAQEAMNTNISTALAGANESKKQAVKDAVSWLGTGAFTTNQADEIEILQWLYDNDYTRSYDILSLPNSDIWDISSQPSFDDLLENRKYAESIMNAIRIEFGDESAAFKWASDAYNDYNDILTDAISDIDNANKMIAQSWLLAAEAAGSPTSLDEFQTFRETVVKNLSGDQDFDSDGSFAAEDLVDSLLSENTQYRGMLSALKEREAITEQINEKKHAIAKALSSEVVGSSFDTVSKSTGESFTYIPQNQFDGYRAIRTLLEDLSDEDLELAYKVVVEQGATSWDDVTAALAEYNSEQAVAERHCEELRNRLKGLWSSEDFEDTKDELIEMAHSIDGITAENIKELASESDALSTILQQDGMDAQFLAKVLQSMAEGNDGLALITEDALKLNQTLFDMAKEFDEVTAAKSRYDSAMSVDEKDTNFKSYAEAFEELNNQFEAGTVNSNAFWAAAEYLFGDEQLSAWGWSEGLDTIYKKMKEIKPIFGDAESAGAGFVNTLYKLSEAGKLVDDNGEKLLEISKLSDGSYDFDIDTKNLDALAEKLGITKEALVACLQALSMWGDVNFYDLDEVAQTIREIGLAADTVDGTAVNAGRLTEQLLSLGKTSKEVHDILSALQGLDGVTLLDVSADVDTLTGSLKNLGLATEDGVTISVNYEGFADLLASIGFTKDEAQTLISKLGEADNISLANANGEVKDVSDALEYIDTLTFDEVTSNLNDVTTAVENIDESSTDNAVSELNDVGTAAEQAATKVYSIGTAIDSVNGRTVTVTYDVKKKSSILGGILGFASGTNGAPGGDSLVGEEGPELVQSGRYAYLVGTNGAEIVNLNRGDRVYTADDTKRILNGRLSQGKLRGIIPSYAFGTINTGTNKTGSTGKYKDYQSSSKSGSKDGSSSGAPWGDELKYYKHLRSMELLTDQEYYDKLDELLSRYYANRESYIDDYRSLMEEAYQLARTLADDWFNDKEHQLFLMGKNDTSEEDQIAVYREMQNEAHRLAEEARKYGLDENSDYIQSLQKQWWSYQDSIEDLYNAIFEKEVDARKNTLNLLNNQYGALDNNRNRNGMAENLQRQLAEQTAIQEAAHKEAQRLRALGVDENDEAIQKCIDMWWDAYNDIQDINSKIADNVLSVYDDFIERADDFDLWNSFDFTRVDYLKRKLKEINRLYQEGILNLKEYNELLREVGVEIYNEQKDALEEIIERTMDLIRQETEDHIEALEDQIDAFRKIIELKKESLRASKDEDDYQAGVAKRVKEIADKQAKLAQLERDTSASANAEKAKLAEELAELQNELAEYQADYGYNAQIDALDREADAYEQSKNKEIDHLKSIVNSEVDLYNAAIARIDSDWEQLYADLMAWNEQYGDMIDGPESITTAWRTAKSAAEEYGSVLSALSGIKNNISYAEDQANNAAAADQAMRTIISEMYSNSIAHHSADAAGKKHLSDRNLELGAALSQYGISAVRGDDGVWYLDKVGGAQLYDKYRKYTYHDGGVVGEDPKLKPNELTALLEKGERVVTKAQNTRLLDLVKSGTDFISGMIGRLSSASPVVSDVEKAITNNDNSDSSVTEGDIKQENHFHLEGVTEENMKSFAEYYSSYTINKLIQGNRRKGLKNSIGSHMLRG